jgi:hypothetical protein
VFPHYCLSRGHFIFFFISVMYPNKYSHDFYKKNLAGGVPCVPALLPWPRSHGHGHRREPQRRHFAVRARIRSQPFRLRLPGQVHALSARPRRRLLPVDSGHTGAILDLVHWKKKDD